MKTRRLGAIGITFICDMRHQALTMRTPDQTSQIREKSFSAENVNKFFENLSAVLTEKKFDALSIWNMGETCFSTAPTEIGKVISLRG